MMLRSFVLSPVMSQALHHAHEEADTRVILHHENAVKEGFSKVTMRTVDTDVLVLAGNGSPTLPLD